MTINNGNDMHERLGSIDDRLAALVGISERQAENLDRTNHNLDRLSDEVRDLVTSSREQRQSIEQLVTSSREQRQSTEQLRQSIQLMATMVGEMVRW
jgi:methyl-accepting chemotaxis protein